MFLPKSLRPQSDRDRLAMLQGLLIGDPKAIAALSVTENTTDETKYDVFITGTTLANGSPVSSSTPSSSALLSYLVYIGGVVAYKAEIAPNADPTVIGNWTYDAGGSSRSVAQFEAEIVDNIDAGGSGASFTFSKLEWAYASSYIQDFAGLNDPQEMTWEMVLTDVLATQTATSPQRLAPIKSRDGRFTNPIYVQIENGEIFITDYGNHAVRRLIEDVDFSKLRVTTISGEPPRGATSGFVPTAGATVDGKDARHNRPEGISLVRSLAQVNGYFRAWAIDRQNKQYYEITRKATTDANDEGLNWETTDLGILTTYTFPSITVDPTRIINGQPVFYDGSVGIDIHYFDGANWVTTNIFPLHFNSGVNGMIIDGNGDLYVTNFDSSIPRLTRVELTGADPTNAADWTLREDIKIGTNFTEWYDVTSLGNDGSGKPRLILPYSTYDEVYLLEHNGGATNTAADWDETLLGTIPSPTAATYPAGVDYDSVNDRLILAGFLTHDVWSMDVGTNTFEMIAGESLVPNYENSSRY